MMETREYVYPDAMTRRRRVVVAVWTGIGVLAFGLLVHLVVRPWLDGYFAGLNELAKHDPPAAGRTVLRLVGTFAALSGSLLAMCGFYLAYVGWQTVRAKRWPYPGMKIYRRWRILDGRAAVRRGRLLLVVGLAVAILGPVLAWRVYFKSSTLLDRLRSDSRPQPTAPNAAAESDR
jgi:hypothetical protein